jgi:predicted nucleic acid-binding protein
VYLIDTNVWLERLLDQTRSDEVGRLLREVPSDELHVTDFAFHSIGVTMTRLGKTTELLRFVQDAFIDGGVALVRLDPADSGQLVRAVERFDLDFDDAYQYVAAEKHGLTLISLDADFDRTERGRKTPAEILAR